MFTSVYLPTITMANCYRISSHGVGTIHLLPSLSIDKVIMSLSLPLTYCLLVISFV